MEGIDLSIDERNLVEEIKHATFRLERCRKALTRSWYSPARHGEPRILQRHVDQRWRELITAARPHIRALSRRLSRLGGMSESELRGEIVATIYSELLDCPTELVGWSLQLFINNFVAVSVQRKTIDGIYDRHGIIPSDVIRDIALIEDLVARRDKSSAEIAAEVTIARKYASEEARSQRHARGKRKALAETHQRLTEEFGLDLDDEVRFDLAQNMYATYPALIPVATLEREDTRDHHALSASTIDAYKRVRDIQSGDEVIYEESVWETIAGDDRADEFEGAPVVEVVLSALVRTLSPRQAKVMWLTTFDPTLTQEEIAEQLHISPESVKEARKAARAKLRDLGTDGLHNLITEIESEAVA